MAYLIDETYFIREYAIPNITEIDVVNDDNPFSNWIDVEARAVLQMSLGWILFKDFDTNVVNGVYVPNVTKWDNLVTGLEYTFKGVTYQWSGLLYVEGTVKRSLLTPYVFSKWFKYFQSQMTGMGEAVGSAANSFIVEGATREAKAWNDFQRFYGGDVSITEIVAGINPDTKYQNTHYVSLLKFLLHNKDDYPDPALILQRPKNRFSI
ncbi:MAG: hypothetical protein ACUZ8H_01435 [Candidatus Anammoxibacter sp.]